MVCFTRPAPIHSSAVPNSNTLYPMNHHWHGDVCAATLTSEERERRTRPWAKNLSRRRQLTDVYAPVVDESSTPQRQPHRPRLPARRGNPSLGGKSRRAQNLFGGKQAWVPHLHWLKKKKPADPPVACPKAPTTHRAVAHRALISPSASCTVRLFGCPLTLKSLSMTESTSRPELAIFLR